MAHPGMLPLFGLVPALGRPNHRYALKFGSPHWIVRPLNVKNYSTAASDGDVPLSENSPVIQPSSPPTPPPPSHILSAIITQLKTFPLHDTLISPLLPSPGGTNLAKCPG